MNRAKLIGILHGTRPVSEKVVDDQTVNDIIARMLIKHRKCQPDYDKIYKEFEGGSLKDICYRLWRDCRATFNYKIEDGKAQYVSAPLTMLQDKNVDCKNYALFIAGVLDAMKRHGRSLTWQFRYACYELFGGIGHVFVVVNPSTDNIWVDPVIPIFNYHLFYWYCRNKRIRQVGGLSARIGNAEGDLLAALKEYSDGVASAVQVSRSTNTLNTITQGILNSVGPSVPGIAQALALVNSGQVLLNDAFGPGSLAARLLNDIKSPTPFILINVIKDVFNGRTYNTDQYWGAVYYQFYVQGRNTTDQSQVTDGDVATGLKWFIDRLLIFISGREHILAIIQSPQAYKNLYNVNSDTTTDDARINAAHQVAAQWFIGAGHFDQSLRGTWAGCVGVADGQLIAIAKALGETPEQVAAQTGYQYAQDNGSSTTGILSDTKSILIAAAAMFGAALLLNDN